MRLAGINLHPVKSTAIRPVERAYVERTGLRGDRAWMLVYDDGEAVTARELPSLFGIRADLTEGGLRLEADGHDPLEVTTPTRADAEATMFGRPRRPARSASEADAWIADVTGRRLRLVHCGPEGLRPLSERYPDGSARYQDSSPVSIASMTSVTRLNEWMSEPLPVQRFRANLVVEGAAAPFEEDGWTSVRIGDAVFTGVDPIDRCVMTTIDPVTHRKGKDPIRTLARHRRWDGKVWFALHLVPTVEGEVAVGDAVHLG
ncbi:MOSC N-terminal beta barrel domain-containing protein [Nocardioides sp. CER19]|uniref:MOSC domain-containing protein n=1 Tax=Nocardioides sp. CER19 TaxID=3038538 RepID=UPI00244933C6|nr:MOSC N-terminal beta barrel domain-containing protein [Nocardioides sp. CER19]MDH2412713.1 MOSC domain-containing protein [Nocardioides sp. CER19]